MTAVEQNGLSGRDLRIKLFDLMKSKGIVDNVKSHLRGRLIDELRGGVDDQIRFASSSNPATLLVRALNALIVDYFQEQKYEYTTSVFIPEANVNDHKAMSNEEILRLLNISTESTFFKKIKSSRSSNGRSSLLMSMLTSIASWLPGSSQSSGTQTSNDLWAGSIAGSTLDEKLNNLEAMYSNRHDDLASMHNLSTEEKLLLFQKNIEARTRENLKQQMDQFRENEMKKIREEERQKCQMELQSLRKELETLYKSKQETLNEKESRIGERFKADLENERRELFAQRQTFLEELKNMKLRETENQRNLELRERTLTLETDRLKRLDDDMRKREVILSSTEVHIDQQVQMKLSKLRYEIEQQFTERNKNLQLIEMRTQEEARRVSEERLLAEQAKTEVSTLRKHYSEADSTIHRLQSEVKVLQNENEILREKTRQVVDYQSIREENAVLKSQMNNTTSRSHRRRHDSGSSSPHDRTGHSRGIVRELKQVLDNQAVGHQVVNDELVDLKTQIAMLQSSNEPEPYFNGRFSSNHGGDHLSRVLKSASDVQLNQSRYSTSSNYNQFIEDAKLRMHELDREADRVEEHFRDYQHRIVAKPSFPSQNNINHASQSKDVDYLLGRRMPSAKPNGHFPSSSSTTIRHMPTSTSLQDINAQTQKYHWNKDQRLISLPESLSSAKNGSNDRARNLSQSDDRIFEHPEVTIKPSTVDDRMQRRAMTTTLPFNSSENGGGSVPNMLEHPDMRAPLVMQSNQLASPSSSSSSSSSDKRRILRQQSADVYSTLARTTSPSHRLDPPVDANQTRSAAINSKRSRSPGSLISNILESPEPDKNDDTQSSSSSSSVPPSRPANKPPIQIIRQYSETSSASDIDPMHKQSDNNNNHHQQQQQPGKAQSEEDDFW